MDDKTLAALHLSIRHWEDNLKAGSYDEANISPDSCALCRLFYCPSTVDRFTALKAEFCNGCPIFEKTGQRFCKETPYIEFNYLMSDEEFQTSAQSEIDFLRSLIPAEKEAT